ncbi:DUF6443 domain-containing protein [Arcicella lustrica]|uniref:DUF6443 domain-containing protein n=1 Tax=Arcicella lustrica TaxID=2984196 RepID=A0ABU5SP85_9BACT|nr:DUF6443 domain-containing protein [Arcicella sp. DC25W]MEA5429124.1 DUF6443 domain-containing protein [Arcicella sp. DC25W]
MFYQQYFYLTFKRLTLFIISFLGFFFQAESQSTANAKDRNFVRESSFQQSGAVVSTEYNNPSKVQHKITYFDGLGRPIQTVLPAQGAAGQDIITAIEYDAYGRPSKSYLPYPKSSGTGDLDASFSNNATSFYGGDIRSFSESVYENSPLNRVVKQAGAGSGWGFNSSPTAFDDGTVKVKTFANVANDVMLFTVSNIDGAGNSFGASSTPVSAGGFAQNSFYAASTLLVTETLDENNTNGTNGGRSREYKDRSGKVVLKRNYDGSNALDTYYVYDDFGQLRGVIPPKLSKLFSNGTSANNLAIAFNQLGFIYCYDDQGRLVKKKVPDAGWVSMTYTATDLLATQTDAKGTVSYFLYDNLNRVNETGVNNQWLVKNYYDGTRPASLPSLANPYNNIATDIEKGQLTGTETRILNADGTISTTILKMAVYFDSRSRAVRTYKESFDGSSVVSATSYLKLHYTGRVEESITEQKVSSSLTLKTLEAYSYDHVGRLISTCQTLSELNGSGVVTYTEAPRLLQCQSYDAIGRLTTKKLGRLPAASLTNQSTKEFAEVLTYGYNIRSWATSIVGYQKPDKTNNATGTKNFDFSLNYTDASQYNGNIGKLTWNGVASSFTYDGLNRLKSSTGQHSEVLTYDENGNINTLNRNLSGVEADGLTYSYNNYSNQLLSVSDSKSGTLGYKSPNGGNDFVYDNNGNLTNDADKGIGINYNVLNLVRQVTGNTNQSYLYDGSGAKLAQHNGTTWKAYLGAGEYVGGKLYRMATSEGYIMENPNYVPGSSVGKYNYFYSLKDHLGNVRAVVVDDKDATQVQISDYTAFGVAVSTDFSKNKYLYNGKELQDGTNWLDYGARMYQPELGRWMGVDPAHEDGGQESTTPYGYVFNNPIKLTDPDGRQPCCGGNPAYAVLEQAQSAWNGLVGSVSNFAREATTGEPIASINVTYGAQAGVKVGKYGVEVNAYSKELGSLNTNGELKEGSNAISKGASIEAGFVTGEVSKKLETTNGTTDVKVGNMTLKTQTTTTKLEHSGTVSFMGIKVIENSTVRSVTNGIAGNQIGSVSTERKTSPLTSYNKGGAPIEKSLTKVFSIAVLVKFDVQINFNKIKSLAGL